jgi:hypothetical protein
MLMAKQLKKFAATRKFNSGKSGSTTVRDEEEGFAGHDEFEVEGVAQDEVVFEDEEFDPHGDDQETVDATTIRCGCT